MSTYSAYPGYSYPTTVQQTVIQQNVPQTTVVITQAPNTSLAEVLQHKRCLFGVNIAWMWLIIIFLLIMAGLALSNSYIILVSYNSGFYFQSVDQPFYFDLAITLFVTAGLLFVWIIFYTAYGGCLLCGCCCCNDIRNAL